MARDQIAKDVLTVLQEAVSRPSGTSISGLGKGLGTPERFSGVDEAWAGWSFVFKGYIAPSRRRPSRWRPRRAWRASYSRSR